jgi:Rrf2 family protein
MLKISRKGDYGLLLLTALAQAGEKEVVSLRKIARERKMPYKFLSQIAPLLVEAGILGSKEGVGGGYFLARNPGSISVGEVLEVLEGPVTPVTCMRGACFCEPHCVQKNVMRKMASSVQETMRGYTLADLVGG